MLLSAVEERERESQVVENSETKCCGCLEAFNVMFLN